MNPEEKQRHRDERNAAIVKYYLEGHKLSETSRKFQLGRQLVLRILKQHGAWSPYVKSNRTSQVGIAVSDETKQALKGIAEKDGVSVSKLGSDILDDYVKGEDDEQQRQV